MAYQATVIPVMIASPGDVLEEREVVRTVVHEWNYSNSSAWKIMLAPVGWETHSSPELGTRPQELINFRLLKDCDLLVGIFWTRLGTPTGKSSSGTVEEIEEHVASGKPAMIYFSSKPISPGNIDMGQYDKVKEIREKWKKQGLIESYDSIDEFKTKFSKQLQTALNKNPYLQELMNVTDNDFLLEVESDTSRFNNSLSIDAKEILKAAASRDDGTIMKIILSRELVIQAGGHTFSGKRGRETANLISAIEELENAELIQAQGYSGNAFELTAKGWEIADTIT